MFAVPAKPAVAKIVDMWMMMMVMMMIGVLRRVEFDGHFAPSSYVELLMGKIGRRRPRWMKLVNAN